MWKMDEPFVKTDRQKALYSLAKSVSDKVKKRAKETDREGTFSLENLNDLKQSGYITLTLPEEIGGKNASLYEFLLSQEKLAEGDPSVALSIGWHLGIVMELRDEQLWTDDMFNWLGSQIIDKHKIINRAATEPATGSPTRGGIPETNATKTEDGYILNGRKSFTSMADVLDYYIVSASIEDTKEIGWFLVERNQKGVEIEHTWDTLGMRGTASDDLVLNTVHVAGSRMVETKKPNPEKSIPKGWLLHIPACYLGIALAARNDAIEFAQTYQPNSLNKPISEVPHIQEKIGKMDLALLNARYFMYAVAEKWDAQPDKRSELGPDLAAVKTIATNTANDVVDLAMRIVGGRGLSKSSSFERYYRDVRAGLHNPPMDDAVIQTLARRALHGGNGE
ncbi:acyl-CoA dehydrogenase family protein [Pseudalkalibacillus sp. Hm43]|uniref:acyl-CoA dehydrogenase family protein n=1 Tax=Pseudalkalibacillus sp. Hm43 TaxID=3450742 RepID=UPI003F42F44A